MNAYQWVSLALALSLYVPLSYKIVSGSATQNLATFILWGSLDAIAGAALYKRGGNYQLPFAYVAGCTIVIISIFKSKNFGKWTWYESAVSSMVVICIVVWTQSGSWYAAIFSTAGVIIGGLPQLKDSWQKPIENPTLIYFGYTLANGLNTVGGKAWTVEERLYSGTCTILCLVIAIASMRGMTSLYIYDETLHKISSFRRVGRNVLGWL